MGLPKSLSMQKTLIDQLGRKIEFSYPPNRIVSTVPSQTELLFDLGLESKIVGITWFCIHPEEKVKKVAKIGGTKNLKIELIRQLKPDLIIANKEENEKAQVEELSKEFPVWISDIKTLDDSFSMMKCIGEMTGTAEKANQLISEIKSAFQEITPASSLKTLYLIWRKPYMSIGNQTFIHSILTKCGLVNVCGDSERYPELTLDQIQQLNPELILLSSEPYPFKDKHIEELKSIAPNAKIMLVDGEMFSWYGCRLLKAGGYLKDFIASL